MRISDWSSDVFSSDLAILVIAVAIFIAHHAPEGELARNDRDVGRALQPRGVEAAVHRPRLDPDIVEIRPLGPDRDRAAGRVLAEERSLRAAKRSEEHTSELQSLMRISYAVFCLKKTTQK